MNQGRVPHFWPVWPEVGFSVWVGADAAETSEEGHSDEGMLVSILRGWVYCGARYDADVVRHRLGSTDSDHAVSARLAGTMFIFILGMGLVFYVYMALALQTIAKKTGSPDGWLSWIPLANIILMLNIAKKPLWWILLFLVR
jgi:hypothetical protein